MPLSHPLTTDTIALWRLNETSASANAIDVGPNGFTGVKGASDPAVETGAIGGARSFGLDAAASDYIFTVADDAVLQPENFTIACWVDIRTTSKPAGVTTAPICIKTQSAANDSFYLGSDAATNVNVITGRVVCTGSSGTDRVVQSSALANGYHHLALTFDGVSLQLYVDGVLQDTETSLGSGVLDYSSPSTLGIGADPDATGDHTPQIVDDLAIYSTAKSAAWIARAAAKENGPSVDVYVPSLYVDNLRTDFDAGHNMAVINTVPEDLESNVRVDAPISLHIVLYAASDSLENVTVSVAQGSEAPVLAYDQAGSGIQAAFAGPRSSATLQHSIGLAFTDEILLVLDPLVPLSSEADVTVSVHAEAGTVSDEDFSYTFTTEDAIAPRVEDILWLDPRRARLKFNKQQPLNSTSIHGTRFLQTLSAAFEFKAPNQLLVRQTPDSDWIGYYLTATGSAYPQNNQTFTITAVDSANRLITLDSNSIVDDNGADFDSAGTLRRQRNLRATITSYALAARPQDESAEDQANITCAYVPVCLQLEEPEADQIPAGDNPDRYLIATFHDDISFGRKYRISTTKVQDVLENEADPDNGSYLDFTTPRFGIPANRATLLSFIPELVRLEDQYAGGELHRMICALQDLFNSLWYRADQVQYLADPDLAPKTWLPYMLYNLGNPFKLELTEIESRRLASALADVYQRAGTAALIEDIIEFFLGIPIEVVQFLTDDWWVLGTDSLGIDTVLGAGSAYSRNSYEIISSQALTDAQRAKMTQIAETLDPLYMHLIRIVEP